MGRAYSSQFNPKQLGGLAQWFSSDFPPILDYITNNNVAVSSNIDRAIAGTARNMVNGTTVQRPTLDYVNTLNGYPAYSFNGAQRLFISPSSICQNISGLTVFAVAQRSAADAGAGSQYVWAAASNTGVGSGLLERACLGFDGGTDLMIAGGRKSDTDSLQTANSLTSMSRGTPHILSTTIDFSKNRIRTFLDGNPDCAQDATTRILGYTDPVTQGSMFGCAFQEANGASATDNTSGNGISLGGKAGGTFLFNGQIWEVIVYQRVLREDERKQVEAYLALKYALNYFGNYTTWITYDGSSSTFGAYLLGKDKRPNVVHQLLGAPSWVGFQSDGVSGSVLSTQTSDAAAINGINNKLLPPKLQAGKRLLVLEMGQNDIAALGHTPAATFADLVTYITAAKAAGFDHIFMILPHARQTSAITLQLQIYWDYCKTNVAQLVAAGLNADDGLIDTTVLPYLYKDGDYLNMAWFQSDNLHLRPAGEALKSGLIAAAIKKYI